MLLHNRPFNGIVRGQALIEDQLSHAGLRLVIKAKRAHPLISIKALHDALDGLAALQRIPRGLPLRRGVDIRLAIDVAVPQIPVEQVQEIPHGGDGAGLLGRPELRREIACLGRKLARPVEREATRSHERATPGNEDLSRIEHRQLAAFVAEAATSAEKFHQPFRARRDGRRRAARGGCLDRGSRFCYIFACRRGGGAV